MEKLTNIKINQKNSTLQFTVQLIAEIDLDALMIFVDNYTNYDNMYSDQSQNHTYYFNPLNSDIELEDLGENVFNVTIHNDAVSNMDNHMKYIKMISGSENYITEGIFYDASAIGKAEIQHLKKTCNMCLDDKTMRLMLHVVFKRQLLDSLLETNDCNACMVLYNDLCRLLNVSDNSCCNSNEQVHSCVQCAGGCCSLI